MRYVRLGTTGMSVSELCLGCMSFGTATPPRDGWKLTEEPARNLIRHALDAGITFFDTANIYSLGVSEEITGRALHDFARREEVVLATKVFGVMRPGPNGSGLSRKAILHEVDESLRRLGTDYIDLYQIHRFDPATPLEETLETLDGLVRAGKVRYLGASSMYAWQFAKAQYVAESHGWTRFSTMQNRYSLVYREEEREMLPLCLDQGVGSIPWAPLAQGRLARPWDAEARRGEIDAFGRAIYEDNDEAVVGAVGRVSERLGVPRAQIALAWVLRNPAVTAPIIGTTKAAQIDDAVAALEVVLSDEDVAELEADYLPHAVYGHQ